MKQIRNNVVSKESPVTIWFVQLEYSSLFHNLRDLVVDKYRAVRVTHPLLTYTEGTRKVSLYN